MPNAGTEPGNAALEVDALTTRSTRRFDWKTDIVDKKGKRQRRADRGLQGDGLGVGRRRDGGGGGGEQAGRECVCVCVCVRESYSENKRRIKRHSVFWKKLLMISPLSTMSITIPQSRKDTLATPSFPGFISYPRPAPLARNFPKWPISI